MEFDELLEKGHAKLVANISGIQKSDDHDEDFDEEDAFLATAVLPQAKAKKDVLGNQTGSTNTKNFGARGRSNDEQLARKRDNSRSPKRSLCLSTCIGHVDNLSLHEVHQIRDHCISLLESACQSMLNSPLKGW